MRNYRMLKRDDFNWSYAEFKEMDRQSLPILLSMSVSLKEDGLGIYPVMNFKNCKPYILIRDFLQEKLFNYKHTIQKNGMGNTVYKLKREWKPYSLRDLCVTAVEKIEMHFHNEIITQEMEEKCTDCYMYSIVGYVEIGERLYKDFIMLIHTDSFSYCEHPFTKIW